MAVTAYRTEGSPMSPATGARRAWLLVVGIVLVVAGLVAGPALWLAAANRYDDAISGLARAPVGCDTTLDFSRTGRFFLFVETRGELASVRGDCDTSGRYEYTGERPPSVALTVFDPDGNEIDLTARSGVSYDGAGFAGESVQVLQVATTGDHVLRVESTDSEFVVAVGRDPNDGVGLLRAAAVLAGLIGVLAGVVCIVVGARRRPAPSAAVPGWTTVQPLAPPGTWMPTVPPLGPPQAWPPQPPTAPPTYPSSPPAMHPPGIGGGVAPMAPGGWARPPGAPDAVPTDGSSGDGERSPWAPPHDG